MHRQTHENCKYIISSFWVNAYFDILIAQTSAHYQYLYSYRSCLRLTIRFLGGLESDFQKKKVIFSSPENKLSDISKTYIDITNGQKFEL